MVFLFNQTPSKRNPKLPQSTTRVLINIQAFALKSGPVYSSFPSICKSLAAEATVCREALCMWRLTFALSLAESFFFFRLPGKQARKRREGGDEPACSKKKVNIELVLVASPQTRHYSHCRRLPDLLAARLISTSNIWGNEPLTLHLNSCFVLGFLSMSPQLQSTVWGRTHRAGLPIIIDRSQNRQTLDTIAPCLLLLDGLIAFHTHNEGQRRRATVLISLYLTQ